MILGILVLLTYKLSDKRIFLKNKSSATQNKEDEL